jgi:hypothetical protein
LLSLVAKRKRTTLGFETPRGFTRKTLLLYPNAAMRSRQKVLAQHRLATTTALADTAIDRPNGQRYNRPPVTDGKSSFYKNDEGHTAMSG